MQEHQLFTICTPASSKSFFLRYLIILNICAEQWRLPYNQCDIMKHANQLGSKVGVTWYEISLLLHWSCNLKVLVSKKLSLKTTIRLAVPLDLVKATYLLTVTLREVNYKASNWRQGNQWPSTSMPQLWIDTLSFSCSQYQYQTNLKLIEL
jgi:hypothetical protein